jgi:hypothetical protein
LQKRRIPNPKSAYPEHPNVNLGFKEHARNSDTAYRTANYKKMRGRLNLHFIRTVDPTLNYITANAGGRRGGAYAALGGAPAADNLVSPSPVGALPRHQRRWRELGMVDLRAASSIARQRGFNFTSAGGKEAEERMGFGPHPPRRPPYMGAFRGFGLRTGSVFEA